MNDITSLRLQQNLKASAEEAYRIVVEVERFSEFMDNIITIDVLEDTGDTKVVAWEMMIDDAPLEWVERVVYDADRLRAYFEAIEGVFEKFDGVWQVYPQDSGSRVELQVHYSIGIPEIEEIIGPILKERLTRNLESMLACLEERAND